MPNIDSPDLSLFLDILRTLERIGAPYMIIGGFGATMYGYLAADPTLVATFDEAYLDEQAQAIGPKVVEFWQSVKAIARREASQGE